MTRINAIASGSTVSVNYFEKVSVLHYWQTVILAIVVLLLWFVYWFCYLILRSKCWLNNVCIKFTLLRLQQLVSFLSHWAEIEALIEIKFRHAFDLMCVIEKHTLTVSLSNCVTFRSIASHIFPFPLYWPRPRNSTLELTWRVWIGFLIVVNMSVYVTFFNVTAC